VEQEANTQTGEKPKHLVSSKDKGERYVGNASAPEWDWLRSRRGHSGIDCGGKPRLLESSRSEGRARRRRFRSGNECGTAFHLRLRKRELARRSQQGL